MSVYEEVALSAMLWDQEELMYYYKCPCGDLFEISLEELHDGEDVAPCPSCSLKIRVLFEEVALPPLAGPYPESSPGLEDLPSETTRAGDAHHNGEGVEENNSPANDDAVEIIKTNAAALALEEGSDDGEQVEGRQ